MKRRISALVEKEYDLVVIGGGIFGICAAWDAALRGLSVALLERGDFAHAASANCFKIVHGGIRYLQHVDLYRMRESSRERRALLRIAPHLVRPLPIVIPTYGHGMKGKEILKTGLCLYDLVTFDRNRGLHDPEQRIPPGETLSREECLQRFPGLRKEGLTGAVVFHDGQMYSPPRLALSFLRSAVDKGVEAANYVEATDFLRKGDRICGVRAKDILTEESFEVRGKVVLNAAGPWAERLLKLGTGLPVGPQLTFSRDACFIVARPLLDRYALAVQGGTKDPDAVLSRGSRHLFMVPWRHHTLIGVWHMVHKGSPDEFTVTDNELQAFLDEINAAYPVFGLTLRDVAMWNAGLVLFGENEPGATHLSYGKRSILVDHDEVHRIQGLITLIGVRFTTARGVAEKTIDLVFKKLGKQAPRCRTAETPIWGGQIDRFQDFTRREIAESPRELTVEVLSNLLHNYGSEYRKVLKYLDENRTWGEAVEGSNVIKAEIIHAVREEMAVKLSDVVLRRTELGSAHYPGEGALRIAVDLIAAELGWSQSRLSQELKEVHKVFPSPVRPEACLSPRNGKSSDLHNAGVVSPSRDV